MIKINENYYSKDVIKSITKIESKEVNCVFYFEFSVFINMGDGVVVEKIIADNDSDNSLGKIKYLHDALLRDLNF